MIITGNIKQKPEIETGDLIRYDNELYIVGFIDKTVEGDSQPWTIDCLISPYNGRVIEYSAHSFHMEVMEYGEVIAKADQLKLSW